MTRPSRNDIRTAAIHFVHEWKDETSERGEAQSFWTDFLTLFGVERRRVRAAFERHARRSSTGGSGFIDVIWPGMLLAEHKSRGEDLGKAIDQALDYLDSLPDKELPRLVVASDFARMAVIDLDTTEREVFEFPLTDLPRQIDRFLALAGYASRRFDDEDAVNVRAAELLGHVYDELEATGYGGHPLRVLIVRALFVLFGDETGLWPRKQFADLLLDRTSADGADLGMWLTRLFRVLDTPDNQRSSALDEDLNAFPYVNGGLFAEHIEPPDTTRTMRDRLVEACQFDWSQISPAIFGSMFQSVMDPEERRALGMHYTSERNILKVVSGLFLDDLRAELEACGTSRQRLRAFHNKLASLKLFDPACLAERQGWAVLACDLGVDMTTPTGGLLANVTASVAEWERKIIGTRTREALAARKAAGVRLGRPRQLDPAIADLIRAERASGATFQAIADRLNAEGITTPTARAWSPTLVRKVALQEPETEAVA